MGHFNTLFLLSGLLFGGFFQFLVQAELTLTRSHEYAACVNSCYDMCVEQGALSESLCPLNGLIESMRGEG